MTNTPCPPGSVVTARQWADAGGTRSELHSELASQRLIRVRRGVYLRPPTSDKQELHRLRMTAAVPSLSPNTYFSHTSAAVVHELPLLAKRTKEMVAVRTGGGHGTITRTLHARIARLEQHEVTVVDGLPVTNLTRTVADLVRSLPFPEAVMVADAGLARGLDRAELLFLTAKGRGCRMARRALLFADPRAESPGESLSRVRIDAAGLPTPVLQRQVRSDNGTFLARVDFCWEEFGVVGEFDGAKKYYALLEPGQSPSDVIMAEKRREQLLFDATWWVVRWTWDELWNHGFESRLRRALETRRQHRFPWFATPSSA
ncbi:MAG: hypothetical protein QM628_06955 [Propionicimonas sp.]